MLFRSPVAEYKNHHVAVVPQAGADIIELGVPYSDPLADGPVIQAAASRALTKGVNLDGVLALVKQVLLTAALCDALSRNVRLTSPLFQVAPTLRAPLILFTYYNPILRRGLEQFIAEIAAAGVGGLLIPDIPLEETTEARNLCTRYNLELVLLATPTTQTPRMARIAEATAGFVYLVSVTGVTGVQDQLQDRVERLVAQLKGVTNKPVAVGFGVSRPEQAAQLAAWGADGVIVGSALVRALGEAPTPGAPSFCLVWTRHMAAELRQLTRQTCVPVRPYCFRHQRRAFSA